MQRVIQARPWAEIGPRDRAMHIVAIAGFATCGAAIVILLCVQGQAVLQPHFLTGMYQYPYTWTGGVSFLTRQQEAAVRLSHFLMLGWFVGAVAAAWASRTELKACSKTRCKTGAKK